MQKHSKQSKVSIKSILCVLLLIVGLSMFSSMRANATTIPSNPPSYSSLTPHDPISITSDSGLAAFPGSGTEEDPYVIEGYDITTTEVYGISIHSTTKYFIIRNCYIDANNFGIYTYEVASGTATIINNTCSNSGTGIHLSHSSSSTVANNTCNNNDYYGIYIDHSVNSMVTNNTCNNNNVGIYLDYSSSNSTVANNTCNYNEDEGIYISSSESSTVANNTCSNNNRYGIGLDNSSSNSTVTNNTCNNNNVGIVLYSSDSSKVSNNTCSKNNNEGIKIWISDFCNITFNLLQENEEYGVYSTSGSDNTLIHHNTFVDNNLGGTSQAKDDGTTNTWYDTETFEGNYWSDWSGTGSYSIDGTAGAIDLYPLDKPTVDYDPPLIVDVIHSPSTPTELDTISINATVTDVSGIYNVTLHYKINLGTWTEVSMTIISGDIYSVVLGSFAVYDTIEYYISAIDNSINHNEATEDNEGLYYVLTVGSSDVIGPTITDTIHFPPTPTDLDTVIINATVTDDSGINKVTLYYKIYGGSSYMSSMTLVSGDTYSVTIGPFAAGDTIGYYIVAVDNSANHNQAIENNNGQLYDIFIGSSDFIVPAISDIEHSPYTPTELDSITINATVTDDSGIYNVTLHCRVNSGTWTEVSMTLISGDIYSVTIGSFAISDSIEYYITAVDNSINHNEATEDNGGLYYVLTVGSSDVTGPTITDIIHTPSIPTELDTIIINATVTDDSGIYNVTLHYRINGGTWIEVSMTLVSGDIYSVTIGSFAVGDTIEYYITAVDNSINYNEAKEDNSGLYYSFTVSEVIPEFRMFSPLLPAITSLFLVFGIVVQQRRKK